MHPYNEILSNKKEQITDTCDNMDEFQIQYAKRKKSDPKGNTRFHLWYSGNGKTIGAEHRSVVAVDQAWAEVDSLSTRELLGMTDDRTILYLYDYM